MSTHPEKSSEAFQESKDLSRNPFVALFPSLQHAEEYIKSTKAGIYISQKETQTNEPEDEQQSSLVNQETSSEWHDKTQIINDFLQRGFLFTVLSGIFCTTSFFIKIHFLSSAWMSLIILSSPALNVS